MEIQHGGELADKSEKPRIGIPQPTSFDLAYNGRYWKDYAEAVTLAGGHPVALPLEAFGSASGTVPGVASGSVAGSMRTLRACDGFVLPGSPADVSPELYGQVADPGTARRDRAREGCDREILAFAEQTGTPILGICFGLQSLNVLRGGTLVQDLLPLPVNHAAGAHIGVAHGVDVTGMSLLASLLSTAEAPAHGDSRHLAVNSSHHQAVDIPGDDFTIAARSSEDGIVEAVEGQLGLAPVLAVQWHPERSYASSAASRALFLWLVMGAMDLAEARKDRLR